jgi:hypothetical protein
MDAYWNNTDLLRTVALGEAQENAVADWKAVKAEFVQLKAADDNDLATEKGTIDTQVALIKTNKTALDTARDTQKNLEKAKDKAQEAWDNRDQALDGAEGTNNDALETAKDDTAAAFNAEAVQTSIDDALEAYDEEKGKIEGMRDAFAENQKIKDDNRKDAEIEKADEYIYGKEATAADPAVKGIEQKMRDAEKAFNAANAALSRAEQALVQNSEYDQVERLVNAIKNAMIAALDKEGKLLKEQEYFHVLSEEVEKLQTKRNE